MARFCAQDAARLRADMMAVLGRASAMALPRLLAQLDRSIDQSARMNSLPAKRTSC